MTAVRVLAVASVEVEPPEPTVLVTLTLSRTLTPLEKSVVESWRWRAAGLVAIGAFENELWLRIGGPDQVLSALDWLTKPAKSALDAMVVRATELQTIEDELREQASDLVAHLPRPID